MIRKLSKYLAVVLSAALVVAAVWFGTKHFENPEPTVPSSETEASTSESTTEPSTEPTEPTVAENDIVNVDRLIDRYYSAKINDDAEELNKIVDADVPYDAEELHSESQFIEKYDNFHTYVIPGLTDNYFIVYVRYDIYFNGITVGAPSLNHFVVAKQDDDHYYIYDRAISEEFQSYLEETERSEAVLALRKQVEDELEAACEKNADLNYLMQLLYGAPEPESTTEEESTEELVTDENGDPITTAAAIDDNGEAGTEEDTTDDNTDE